MSSFLFIIMDGLLDRFKSFIFVSICTFIAGQKQELQHHLCNFDFIKIL